MAESESEEERLIYLFQGYINLTSTESENAELQSWVQYSPENEQLFADMNSTAYRIEALGRQQSYKVESALKMVRARMKPAKVRQYSWYTYSSIAASLVLLSLIGFYFYKRSMLETLQTPVYVTDHAPGVNGATLTLASGKKIILNHVANGTLADEAGITIRKTKNGELIYIADSKISRNGTEHYNVLQTANGQQYQVILPDGSHVWLNAASNIKYPASFNGKNRKVELTGEGYFEIVHRPQQPFIVKTHAQEVTVLGTHFNVNAYADEPTTRTTLLEGSVHVSGLSYGPIQYRRQTILKPGQQAILTPLAIQLATVDTESIVSWKNGDFIFKNQELTVTMRQIARWYDVEVVYETGAPQQLKIFGSISRANPVSAVLKAMERTGKVKFKSEGRRIIVSKV